MARTPKAIRDCRRMVEGYGGRVVAITRNGHYHFLIERPGGDRKVFVTGNNPSGGNRALSNFESTVKRWISQSSASLPVDRTQDHAGARHP